MIWVKTWITIYLLRAAIYITPCGLTDDLIREAKEQQEMWVK